MKMGNFTPQIVEVPVVRIFKYFKVFFQGIFGRNKLRLITIA
jgi:hypothetical protein